MSYLLSFAGVPFDADNAVAVRMKQPGHPQSPNYEQTIKKHQPEHDLLDELDRLTPFEYLEDVEYPGPYPGRNLGAIASPYKSSTTPNPQVGIGDYHYPCGACYFSMFRGLMVSSKVKEVVAATSNGTQTGTFVMKSVPKGSPDDGTWTVSTSLYMLPARPFADHGGGKDGLYLVTLVDERFYWHQWGVSLSPDEYSSWDSLITALSTALNVTINYSAIQATYGQPEPDSQFWCRFESPAVLLDAVAFNLGRVVVRNLDGTYSLLTPAESLDRARANRGSPVVRMAGGDIYQSGGLLKVGNLWGQKNTVVPGTVRVTFPKYVTGDDPVPHFANPRYSPSRPSSWYEESYGDTYAVDVPLASGGLAVSGQISTSGLTGDTVDVVHSTAKALYSGEAHLAGAPYNNSGLIALGMQVAQDYYGSQLAAALDETYQGTKALAPEGLHDIIWSYSPRNRKASVRVLRTEWNTHVREMQHATPVLSGQSVNVKGAAGPSVAQTWRDSTVSGAPSYMSTLAATLTSGAYVAVISTIANLPNDRRWKGHVNGEVILFEGTSGSNSVSIARRAQDGTVMAEHTNGTAVRMLAPQQVYGANLVTFGKNQFLYPSVHTSGGVQETYIHPQTQNVYALAGSGGVFQGDRGYYSGQLFLFNTANGTFEGHEYVWITERNNQTILSGRMYGGTFAGYSPSPVHPVYLTDLGGIEGVIPGTQPPASGQMPVPPLEPISGSLSTSGFQPTIPGGSIKYERWFKDDPSDTTYTLTTDPTARDNRCRGNWYYGGEPERAGSVTIQTMFPQEHYIYAMPILEAKGRQIAEIGFALGAISAGGKVRLGIYSNRSDGDLYPDLLLWDTGEIDTDEVGTIVSEICRQAPAYTLLWLVFLANQEILVKAIPTSEMWGLNGTSDAWTTNTAGRGWGAAFTFAALPNRFPGDADEFTTGEQVPAVGIRYGQCCVEAGWYCVNTGDGCPGSVQEVADCDICGPDKDEFEDTVCSGPYDTQEEALEVCSEEEPEPPPAGSGTFSTCGEFASLTAIFSCGFSCGDCIVANVNTGPGQITFVCTWNGAAWVGTTTHPNGQQTTCTISTLLTITLSGHCALTAQSLTVSTCDPLVASGPAVELACCTGTYTISVVE